MIQKEINLNYYYYNKAEIDQKISDEATSIFNNINNSLDKLYEELTTEADNHGD